MNGQSPDAVGRQERLRTQPRPRDHPFAGSQLATIFLAAVTALSAAHATTPPRRPRSQLTSLSESLTCVFRQNCCFDSKHAPALAPILSSTATGVGLQQPQRHGARSHLHFNLQLDTRTRAALALVKHSSLRFRFTILDMHRPMKILRFFARF